MVRTVRKQTRAVAVCGMMAALSVVLMVLGAVLEIVLYAAPMLAAYLLCDVLLTVGMLVLIWKGLLPLKNTAQRILASLCSPIAFAGIVGNLLTLQPWPLNQLDHGTESAGHLLVLTLGLVLLRKMTENGELKEAKS